MTEWMAILMPALALASARGGGGPEADIRAAMEEWRRATLAKDGDTLDRLLHADLTYSHSNGRTQTKAEVIESVTGGKSSVVGIDFGEQTVHVYGFIALVKGVVDMHASKGGVNSTAHLDILHVWLKGPDGWQMVARQASQTGS